MALIEINWRPERQALRGFGWISLVAFAALGAWIYFRHTILAFGLSESAANRTAYVLWALSATCGLLAAVAPLRLRPLYVGMTAVSLPIGFFVSHVVMALLFYGLFTPVAFIFRLIGRDPLDRRFDPAAESYWVERKQTDDPLRYYRQF